MSTDASYLIKSASIRCSTSLVFEGCSFDEQLIVTENSTYVSLFEIHPHHLYAYNVHITNADTPTMVIIFHSSSTHSLDH